MNENQNDSSTSAQRPSLSDSLACSACGVAVPANQRFCGACGASMQRQCSECGATNSAANKFCGTCGAKFSPEKTSSKATDAASSDTRREERRWATVLFADLSGFTALSGTMDPEDVKTLAHQCAERMSEEVRRFGGTVLNVVGDQVVAVFGAPLAHEDDAERALRAGLAIRDCSLSAGPKQPLQVHVGINTGEVMAGLIGPVERRDYTVMGDTVNMAARLMSAAPPGAVLTGEETFRATRRVVRYRELPPVTVKGKEQPLPVWEALEATPLSRVRPLATLAFVGRDEELGLLLGVWQKVRREAQPHLVSVLGDPGLGKTRLVAEFERRIASEAVVVHGRCLPYGEARACGALIDAIREAAAITANDRADEARNKLDSLIAQSLGTETPAADFNEISRHLALLTGLDVETDRLAHALDSRVVYGSARRFLEALARRTPLCLILEDIHWADEGLLDLIEHLAARVKEAPLLLVTQTRPELLQKRPQWGHGARGFVSLPLAPLSEQAARELVLALCHERGLADTVAEQAGRGAAGNPLFAEELVAVLAERGGGEGIPSAIKVLIAARLDALPSEERNLIQIAAVFGKSFWEGGLRALRAAADLVSCLDALEQKDLLRAQARSQFRNEREYIFKHDLIRDVAYETLPRAERRVLHGRIADWIEQTAEEQTDDYSDMLAHHTLSAGQEERALGYLTKGAEQAHRGASYRQENILLTQALEIAERLSKPDLRVELWAKRGKAFALLSRWAEARTDLEAAQSAMATERTIRHAEVLVELADVSYWLQDTSKLRPCATQALAIAEENHSTEHIAAATSLLGMATGLDGDPKAGQELLRRAMRLVGGARLKHSGNGATPLVWLGQYREAIELGKEFLDFARQIKDTKLTMITLSGIGLSLAGLGRYREADRIIRESLEFGREYEIWPLHARTAAISAGFHLDVEDYIGNERIAEETRELARSANFPPAICSTGIDLLLNFARRNEVGRTDKLVDEVSATVEKASGFHGWLWRLRLAAARAEIALARGELPEALRWADETIARCRTHSRVKYETLGLWTRARTLAALDRKPEAITDLKAALELSRALEDPAMLLRVVTALLAIDGNNELLAEARSAAQRIRSELPDDEMCRRFDASPAVQLVSRLGGPLPATVAGQTPRAV